VCLGDRQLVDSEEMLYVTKKMFGPKKRVTSLRAPFSMLLSKKVPQLSRTNRLGYYSLIYLFCSAAALCLGYILK